MLSVLVSPIAFRRRTMPELKTAGSPSGERMNRLLLCRTHVFEEESGILTGMEHPFRRKKGGSPKRIHATQAFALRLRYITRAAPKPSAMRSVTTGAGRGEPTVPELVSSVPVPLPASTGVNIILAEGLLLLVLK